MYRKYALITGFSVGVGLSGPALADAVADAVAVLPGAIEDVRISGSWENADKSGSYRILIARSGLEPITARLFIQWISYEANGAAAVEQSVEIKELADLSLDIVDYSTESDVDGLSIYVETLNPADGFGETYELHLFSPTDYIFGPATN